MAKLLSPSELSYLATSLSPAPSLAGVNGEGSSKSGESLDILVRPDGRSWSQFRPIEASSDFLPQANGSARVRLNDGSECICGVKASCVQLRSSSITGVGPSGRGGATLKTEWSPINVTVNLYDTRTDNAVATIIVSLLEEAIRATLPQDIHDSVLRINDSYAFELYIDVLVTSYSGHPFNLISLATYLALKDTRLPRVTDDYVGTSITEKATIAPQSDEADATQDTYVSQVPIFDDDWESAVALSANWSPPIVILSGIIGNHLLVDPAADEQQILDRGIVTVFSGDNNRLIITRLIDFGSRRYLGQQQQQEKADPTSPSASDFTQIAPLFIGVNPTLLIQTHQKLTPIAKQLRTALDAQAENSNVEGPQSMF